MSLGGCGAFPVFAAIAAFQQALGQSESVLRLGVGRAQPGVQDQCAPAREGRRGRVAQRVHGPGLEQQGVPDVQVVRRVTGLADP